MKTRKSRGKTRMLEEFKASGKQLPQTMNPSSKPNQKTYILAPNALLLKFLLSDTHYPSFLKIVKHV